ncbi:MAG: helix-turn-helix transcriptional regulator [Promethearchaeota archaeon]
MLHNVYLIHQNTGICLIYRKYGSIEFNQDLVSGFLTALKDFSIEFSKGSGELKVIDMQIFYLMLVFKEGVLITAAADKNDDAKVCHKALTDVIDKFVEQYGDKLDSWSGDVRIFRGFEKVIDEILENGKVAEFPLKIPILKIFKKDFIKSQSKLAKKGLVISEDDLRKVTDKKPEWTKKRLPKQVITQGFLTEREYEIAHLADGFHTVEEIAEEAGIPEAEVQKIIDNLDKLGLLKFIEIK